MTLIVTADDLGLDAGTTDAILAAYEHGLVTRASAMVFMADSDRAATRARMAGLPTGLHLNLTEPFTAADVPRDVRRTHDRILGSLGRHRKAYRWVFDPRLARTVESAITTQVEEFRRVFGTPPAHVDGHEHVHACLNVLRARSLRI